VEEHVYVSRGRLIANRIRHELARRYATGSVKTSLLSCPINYSVSVERSKESAANRHD